MEAKWNLLKTAVKIASNYNFLTLKKKHTNGDLLNEHKEISRDQEIGHDFQGTM